MNSDDREALRDALSRAPVMDVCDIPGLPSDPIDLRAHLMWVEHNTFGRMPQKMKDEIKASCQDWLAGGDGMVGPWND